jgi:hypothetical protein
MAFDAYISIPAPKPAKPAPSKPAGTESLSPGAAPPAEQNVPAENKTSD